MTSKKLYFTILQALLGFNIFQSLFSGDISGGSWCGSWFFPNEEDGGTGLMGSGVLECPNQIQGKLTEALWTSIFLLAIWLLSLRGEKIKSESRSLPYQVKSESRSLTDSDKSESKSLPDSDKSESRWPADDYVEKQTRSKFYHKLF